MNMQLSPPYVARYNGRDIWKFPADLSINSYRGWHRHAMSGGQNCTFTSSILEPFIHDALFFDERFSFFHSENTFYDGCSRIVQPCRVWRANKIRRWSTRTDKNFYLLLFKTLYEFRPLSIGSGRTFLFFVIFVASKYCSYLIYLVLSSHRSPFTRFSISTIRNPPPWNELVFNIAARI